MSQQVNFYLLAEEQQWFESVLRQCGEFAVIRSIQPQASPDVASNTLLAATGWTSAGAYLIRPTDIPHLVWRAIPARGSWSVDDLRSPVVQYSRSILHNKVLRRGRLYVITDYFDQYDRKVKKEPTFLSWARCLISKARHALERGDDGNYFGPKALVALRAGEFEISFM